MGKISAAIITYNEELNIGRCIESLEGIVDEILVVDSFSSDHTKAICQEHGVRLIERPFTGFSDQKNFAVRQATHDYVLALDADEYLSHELRTSILEVKDRWESDGYRVSRLSSYRGKWIRSCGWYPEKKVRLWDRRKGQWSNDAVHETVSMNEGVAVNWLKGDLLHDAYDSVGQLQRKNQYYSDLFAKENRFRVKSSPFKIFYKTVFAFFRCYVIQKGFRDGFEGLLIAGSKSEWTFYKYAKLYEANTTLSTSVVVGPMTSDGDLEHVLSSIAMQSDLPDEIILSVRQLSNGVHALVQQFQLRIPVRFFVYNESLDYCKTIARGELIIPVEDSTSLPKQYVENRKKEAIQKRFDQRKGVAAFRVEQPVSDQVLDKVR